MPSEHSLSVLGYASIKQYHDTMIMQLLSSSMDTFMDPIYVFRTQAQNGLFSRKHRQFQMEMKLNEWEDYWFKSYRRKVITEAYLGVIECVFYAMGLFI